MPDLTSQISEAKSQGYNDDEIVGFLGTSHADLAPKIKEAQANGYRADEILGHLAPAYPPGASESRIEHHLQTHPIKMLPSLVDFAVSPITGLANIPQAISAWAKGDRGNPTNYPPGEMSSNPATDAYGNLLAALGTARGTPKPTVTIPRTMREAFGGEYVEPPPSSGSAGLPTQLPWLAKFAIRRLPMGSELVDVANQYLKNRATGEAVTVKPTPSPTWTPTPIAPPPVPKPVKPGPSPSWSRGTVAPPPEAEVRPPIAPENQAVVDRVLAEKASPPPAERPAPVVKEEVRSANMADPEEVAKSAFHTAYRKFPKATYQQELERVIQDQIGPNKTRAWTPEGIAKAKALGKQVLTPDEWDKVHKFLDKLPNKSIEPPPQ